jgi:ABC-type transporter Mla subunit MlaD
VSPALQDVALLRRVGASAIAVIALAISGFVFLPGRVALGSPTRIRVLFRHTGGLREHAALVVAGHAIGRVEAISPVPHGARSALAGDVGVAVTVAIDADRAWQVPARAEIFVASRGVLSDRYLEVAPPAGEPGPAIRNGAELRGADPPSLDGVLQRTWTNLTVFRDFVEAVRPELTALRSELDRLRGELDAIDRDLRTAGGARAVDPHNPGGVGPLIDAMRELVATARTTRDISLGGEPGLAHLRATLDDTRAMLGALRATADRLAPRVAALTADTARVRNHLGGAEWLVRIERAITSARAALDKLTPLLAGVEEVARRIANGEGSVLKLIRDPEFPEDAKDLGKVIKRHPWRILEHAPRD